MPNRMNLKMKHKNTQLKFCSVEVLPCWNKRIWLQKIETDQGGPGVVLRTYGSLDKKRERGQAYLLFTSISRWIANKQTNKHLLCEGKPSALKPLIAQSIWKQLLLQTIPVLGRTLAFSRPNGSTSWQHLNSMSSLICYLRLGSLAGNIYFHFHFSHTLQAIFTICLNTRKK